jgi:hypothetical protein
MSFHFFCKWEIVNVDYVPPLGTFDARGAGPGFVDRAMCGQSIIQLQCPVCGDISQRRVLGKFEKPSGETKS